MLSTQMSEAVAVEMVENQIFALHLRRQVIVQIEMSVGYLVATNREAESDALKLAEAMAGLRAHRPERQSKRPSRV